MRQSVDKTPYPAQSTAVIYFYMWRLLCDVKSHVVPIFFSAWARTETVTFSGRRRACKIQSPEVRAMAVKGASVIIKKNDTMYLMW